MKFSENLYTLRKNRQISQEQLAELVDVSRQSISKWELGESYPTLEKIYKLCEVFKCKINCLVNDELNESTNSEKNNFEFNNMLFRRMSISEKVRYLFKA